MSNEPQTNLVGTIRTSGLRITVFAHEDGDITLAIQTGDNEASATFRLSLGDVDAHILSLLLLDAVKWIDATR